MFTGNVRYSFAIQMNSPAGCGSFTGLLLDVCVWLDMIRALLRPSSGACSCNGGLWFYRGIVVVAAFLVVVWPVINQPDHDQRRSYRRAPTVKPEAAGAVACS